MNNRTFVISDHHFGHEKILEYYPERFGRSIHEHDEWLVSQHNSVVTKHDRVYFLGDVALNPSHLHYLDRMMGQKFLIRGNHDKGEAQIYLKYFENIYGLFRKEQFWLSHAPIHTCSLRNGYNIHGHTHANKVDDDRYICVCIEHTNGVPVDMAALKVKYPKIPREK